MLADFYYIEGSAVSSPVDYLIESTDYNSYKPKAFNMSSYSGNSFHLKFEETGVGTGSSTTVGADSSGQDNHFDSTNIVASDVMMDTPTTNYSTLNPLDIGSYQLKEGNLGATGNNSAGRVRSTMGFSSGKWYWEFYLKDYDGGGGYGIAKLNSLLSSSTGDLGHDSNSWGVLTNN